MSEKVRKTSNKRKNSLKSSFLKVQIFAVIIYTVMFMLTAFIMAKADVSAGSTCVISVIIFSFCSFCIGFISGTKERKNGLINGILYSLPMNIIVLTTSSFANHFEINLMFILSLSALIVASAIGGVISVNKKVRR